MRIAAVFVAVALSVPVFAIAPVQAADLSQTIKLCNANPNCFRVKDTVGDNNAVFCIKTAESPCKDIVVCPKEGLDGSCLALRKAPKSGKLPDGTLLPT